MTKFEPASRQVIEDKLLAVLDDEDKVAIVTSSADLMMLIYALRCYIDVSSCDTTRYEQMLADLKKLHNAAFGGNDVVCT